MGFTLSEVIYVFEKLEKKMTKYKNFLTHLDTKIGDGDHGINMCNGFKAVRENIHNREFKDWSEIFKVAGTTLIAEANSAAGLLYGTAFIRAAKVGIGKEELNIYDFREILHESIEEIKMRGKSEKGDKTILDSLMPALEEIDYGINNNLEFNEVLKNSLGAAKSGVERTKIISARKGRAIYLGDRSLGHQDPGATSALMMLEVVSETVKELRG